MSHHDKEPLGITVIKVIGALLLVLLALVFGALGACGAILTAFNVSGTRTGSVTSALTPYSLSRLRKSSRSLRSISMALALGKGMGLRTV